MYIVPLSLLLPTFALAVALPSTPTTPTTTIPYPRRSPYALKITDFHSICAASACYWEFNVTAPAGGPSGMPAFTASGCIGTTKDGYKECDAVHSAEQQDETEGVGKLVNGSVEVAGKEENLGATVGANVWVRVAWVWNSTTYELEGNQTVKHTGIDGEVLNFDVVPERISAVPQGKLTRKRESGFVVSEHDRSAGSD